MVRLLVRSLYAGLLVFSATVSAQLPDGEQNLLAQQRNVYLALEGIVHSPNSEQYKQLREQLGDYPLAPYIEQQTLLAYPYLANQQKIDQFLNEYKNTPLDWPLRSKWLSYLVQKGQKQLFLQYYRASGDAELTCHYLDYLLEDNQIDETIDKQIQRLWLSGQSQPNECDSVFKAWQKAGFRSDELVWQRLSLAADGGNHTLVPYLKSLLPTEQQYLADLWLNVRRSPSYVSRLSKFPKRFADKELQILIYGLSRLIWRDQELALKTWPAVMAKYSVSQADQHTIASKFAISLAIDDDEKAEYWLEKANDLKPDEELFRWHLAHVLRQQNWQHALDMIDLAPPEISSDLSYQYWQARAYEQVNAPEMALKGFKQLAQQRHYYGFLASGKLSQAPSLVDKPLDFEPALLAEVANKPAARRAYEFLQLGQYVNARREWIHFQARLDDQKKLVSAVLADSWGWHDQAIFGFANTGYLDDVKRRFPMAYSEQLLSLSQQNKIDPAWSFAIARRESSFMADANSSAGAKGLMQLLPGTARYLAKKKINVRTLFDPDTNVGYGTQYLRYLMDKMDNNPILATASYNAGWRKVKNWLPDTGTVPMDIWIETIPYKETRNYVKAVMAYRQIYAMQLGQTSPLFEEIANMQLTSSKLN